MRKLIIALILALGFTLAVAPQAIAHTPSGGATCDVGAFAKAENYNAAESNSIGVQVDDTHIEHNFDTADYVVIPIPDDGLFHEYAWFVQTSNPDPAFSAEGHGKIRCGTPPVKVKHAWFHLTSYCNAVRVEGRHGVAWIEKVRHGDRFVFTAHAKPGHVFLGNGKVTRTKRAHLKTSGCGNVSGY